RIPMSSTSSPTPALLLLAALVSSPLGPAGCGPTGDDDDAGVATALARSLVETPPAERLGRLLQPFSAAAARVFGLSQDQLDPALPLRDHGLDSLMAAELQAEIHAASGVELSLLELLSGRSLQSLAERALPALLRLNPSSPGQNP
ncbi:acyl carrier protein, partial [Myxococcota bacterium]|nr:acyl carrier protein [Myxococcota bacterium]